MAVALPEIPLGAFAAAVRASAPEPLPPATVDRLHAHYEELRRWSARLSLIGPGTVAEVMERHFGESLAALPPHPPPASSTSARAPAFPAWCWPPPAPDGR